MDRKKPKVRVSETVGDVLIAVAEIVTLVVER